MTQKTSKSTAHTRPYNHDYKLAPYLGIGTQMDQPDLHGVMLLLCVTVLPLIFHHEISHLARKSKRQPCRPKRRWRTSMTSTARPGADDVKGEWLNRKLNASFAAFKTKPENLAEVAGNFTPADEYHRGADVTNRGDYHQ